MNYDNNIGNQQDASKMFFIIDCFKLALHVTGDSFAHLQVHFVYTAFWNSVPKSFIYSQSAPEDGRNFCPKHVQ